MGSQVTNGKAFEWAVGIALSQNGLTLSPSPAAIQNESCFNKVPHKKQDLFIKNAEASISHILSKESISSGQFEFLPDSKGVDGDVRDIVITTSQKELGISCKTNHTSYKHSRLSDKVDFVQKWGLDTAGCSKKYSNEAHRIFSALRKIKTSTKGTALWRDQPDVAHNYYWPILNAFEAEVLRIQSPQACSNFIRYLIGTHDFYKIISRANNVEITGFNINRTLNIPQIKLPDMIIGSRSRNGSQYAKTISFNAGWEFNFRIHNASSRVEPSLKFDITATSLPPNLYQHHISH